MNATSRTDSAALLREILTERIRENRRYSMRAFARSLGLSPGGLSLILSRKKRLSVDRAHEVARRLGLDAEEAQCFVLLVEYEGASSPARKAELQDRLGKAKNGSLIFDLGVDRFRLISEWYGLPVLVLFTERSPSPGRKEAATLLDISLGEIDSMLDRLERLELIERSGGTSERPEFRRVEGTVMVESQAPNEALRKYYRGVLDKCESAVESQSPKEKVIGGQVFAIDPSKIDAVRALTDRYLSDLNVLAASGEQKNRTAVYQAVASVFRLTAPSGSPAKESRSISRAPTKSLSPENERKPREKDES